jgi:guanylate kinase
MTENRQLSRYGTALVVSGPSGVGKGTICAAVSTQFTDLQFSVSCTTRDPRPGEIDGEHYYFISKAVFEQKIAAGEFIEHAEVFGNYYGTLQSEVVKYISQGKDVFLDIDIQGAMQIKEHTCNDELLKCCCEFIFIIPPGKAELEKRLRGRNTENNDVIKQRLAKAEYELSFWREYDYIIVNDTVEDAAGRMKDIIRAAHCSSRRYKAI